MEKNDDKPRGEEGEVDDGTKESNEIDRVTRKLNELKEIG